MTPLWSALLKESAQAQKLLRVVLATAAYTVQVWKIEGNNLTNVFSIKLGGVLASTVAFVDNAARDVWVFGQVDGNKYTLTGDKGQVQVCSRQGAVGLPIGARIGRAAVCPKANELVIDAVADGYTFHRLDSGYSVRHFPTGKPILTWPKNVAFAEEGSVIVGGSDHGAVYIFDKASGKRLQILKHCAKKYMAQNVAVHDGQDVTTIACASSDSPENKDNHISVWTHRRVTRPRIRTSNDLTPIEVVMGLFGLFAIVLCCVQNFHYVAGVATEGLKMMRTVPKVNVAETMERIASMREAAMMADYEAKVERIVREWEAQRARNGMDVIDIRRNRVEV